MSGLNMYPVPMLLDPVPRCLGLIAALLLALLPAWRVVAQDIHNLGAEDIALIHALEPEIESLVERTRPASWETRHACLYYALAGRYLLGRYGIASNLVTGAVIYAPRTQQRHSICPHAWLETASHLIDFATLPRLGWATVIPLDRVAHRVSDIRPGYTQVLAVPRPPDPDHLRYIARHTARFGHAVRSLVTD